MSLFKLVIIPIFFVGFNVRQFSLDLFFPFGKIICSLVVVRLDGCIISTYIKFCHSKIPMMFFWSWPYICFRYKYLIILRIHQMNWRLIMRQNIVCVKWCIGMWLFQVYDQVVKCLFLNFEVCEIKNRGKW